MRGADWRRALVAVRTADGVTVGAGFLVAPRFVLTCAHVVGDATGVDASAVRRPVADLSVEFTQARGIAPMSAAVVGWSPVSDVEGGDIAVLTLAAPPPIEPIQLLDSDTLRGHRFRVYGFPDGHDAGLWAGGVISDRVRGGWYQLEDVKVPGSAIEAGFSGGAVYDETADRVVGMVVARDRAAARKIGFMLPTSLLTRTLRDVGVEVDRSVSTAATLSNVPVLPPQFVIRSEVEAVISALRGDGSDGGRVAVVGMGGAGKSVLTAAVCRDDRVRADFPDGVVWVELGPHPVLPTRQAQVAAAFGHTGTVFADAQQGRALLSRLLTGRRYLLVVDNVWSATDLGDLDVVEAPARLVFTTRDAAIARGLGSSCFEVQELPLRQSLSLLAKWARTTVEALPREAAEIAAECGYLALAMAMAGAMVAGRSERWRGVLRRLREADLGKITQQFGNYPYPDLLRAISVGVDALDPDDRQRYLELAVFADREPTVSAARALWERTGLDDLDVTELLDRLADRSLIRFEGDDRFGLHDLQIDYLRRQVADMAGLHQLLVAAYRAQAPDGWQYGPDDGYFHRSLPHHLVAAGEIGQLRGLLTQLGWLQAVLGAANATEVLAAYRLLPRTDPIATVGDALRLSSHALTRSRAQLPAQLVGRLGDSVSPQVQELVAAARNWEGEPWLRPRSAGLTAPGGPLLFTLVGHTSSVREVVLTPDDRYAVSGGWDGSIRVWDLADDGRELYHLRGHEGGIWSLAVSPDGRWVLSGSADGTIRVWDLTDGSLGNVLRGHDGAVWSIALVPKSTLLASASVDGTVRVWDWPTATAKGVLEGHRGIVYTVRAAPDGTTIASKSEDGTLRVWDVRDLSSKWCFDTAHYGVQSRAMALTDRHVLFATDNGVVHCWDHTNGTSLGADRNPVRGQVWSLEVTPDGSTAVLGSASGAVELLDIGPGLDTVELGRHTGWVEMVALSPDGRHVLSGADDGILRLRERFTAESPARALRGHTGWIASAAFSSDGTRVVSAAQEPTLRVWDVTAAAGRRDSTHAAWIGSLTVVDAGTLVVTADDGSMSTWDLRTGRRTGYSVTASPAVAVVEVPRLGWRVFGRGGDASSLPLPDNDTRIDPWHDTGTEGFRRELCGVVVRAGHLAMATTAGLRFVNLTGAMSNPAGSIVEIDLTEPPHISVPGFEDHHIVVGGVRGQVGVWDVRTGERTRCYRGTGGPVISLACTEHRILSGCVSGVLSAWCLDMAEPVWEQHAHDSLLTGILVVGQQVVTCGGDGAVRSWRISDGEPLGVIAEMSEPVRAIAALGDDRGLAIAAGDRVTVYDMGSATETACFSGDGRITAIAALPDGGIACGEAAGAVHILTMCER
ncbi:NB-ARC domain-containing protein [Nocardia sp. NPDC004573]